MCVISDELEMENLNEKNINTQFLDINSQLMWKIVF